MDNKKRFLINMTTQILSFVINLGINFFLSGYIVNVIGKEVYGFVGLANNFISYIQIFTVAFNAMLSRFVTIKFAEKKYEEASKYLSSVTICNIGVSVILLIPSVLLSCFLQYIVEVPDLYIVDIKILWMLVFVSFLIQLATTSFQTCFFVTNRLDLSAKRSLENYFLRATLLFVLFGFFEPHIWYVGVVSLICAIYLAGLNKYYMKRLIPQIKIKKAYFSFEAIRELVGVGIWNSINQLSQLLMTGFDLLIANIFLGSGEMGMLSIAKMVPTQLISFIGMVSNVFSPKMTMAYASRDKNAFLKEVFFSIKVCGALCSVPLIGFIAFGKAFFGLWMNSLSNSEIVQIQILSVLTLLPNIFSVYIFPLYNVNTITCKLKIPVLVSTGVGIANLGIVYVLLQNTSFGIYAVAGVSSVLLLVRILLFVPMYAANNLKVKIFTFYPPIIRGAMASCFMLVIFYSVSKFIQINEWLDLICVGGACGIIGYIINYYIIFEYGERVKLVNLFKNKLNRLKK